MLLLFRRVAGFTILFLTLGLVVYPLGKTSWYLASDTGLRSAAPSTYAFNLHASLSRRLPGYVDGRIASGAAESVTLDQITATESPVYGAYFYLLATENLQALWEKDPSLASRAPKETGAEAIQACTRIILDPGHASWVKKYWGDDYLNAPNCFYRMLVIGSLSAHYHLTGSTEHLALLKQLCDSLSEAMDASPSGLVDDYPDQCFPADVVAAIDMIRRADPNREDWSKKAFRRLLANFHGELPPYTAFSHSGRMRSPSRGCTNGFFFSYARDLDPVATDDLYQKLLDEFWQEDRWLAGWREFSLQSSSPESYSDADSGPVVWGFGTGATGLGIGAARIHGDHRRAGMLGAEMLAGSIPLPDGLLLLPRLVSDTQHAPHFAETAILHQLSLTGGGGGARAPLPR
ncbi:MAG: hypothetical protein JWO82_587, partial [Akkermansiaceae bacterium]|nr:hypothetical protein [Akkermansiaceae bacterium]